MFMLDTETIIAGSLGTAILFFFHRAYVLWRRWSSKAKLDDEIGIDRKIAEAIKNGDVLLVAKLKKYYQTYAKREWTPPKTEKSGEPGVSAQSPDRG